MLESENEKLLIPRRSATSDIKLLRLALMPRANSICEEISHEWTHAQPAETLSPAKAAAALGVEVWAPQSVIKKRYKTLQLRYPPDQFVEQHVEWRPSAELLGNPKVRLNWYWQSGFVPLPDEPLLHPKTVLKNLKRHPGESRGPGFSPG